MDRDDYSEKLIASVSSLIVGCIGIAANGIVVLFLPRIPHLRNAFGYLTVYHSAANFLVVVFYPLWVAPSIYYNLDTWITVNRSIGHIAIVAQAASYHSMLLLALNRFMAVNCPFFYQGVFTLFRTMVYIVIISIWCFAYGFPYFFKDCSFFFDDTSLQWQFSDTTCSRLLSLYFDFYYSLGLFAIVCSSDLYTLFQLRAFLAASIQDSPLPQYSHHKMKREAKFFLQTICNTALFSFTVLSFHVISTHMETKMSRFATTTLMWGINHGGAGIIIILFNLELRDVILRRNPTTAGWVASPPLKQIRSLSEPR